MERYDNNNIIDKNNEMKVETMNKKRRINSEDI